LVEHLNSREERGGSCNDIAQLTIEGGPGLQSVDTHIRTDYLEGEPFVRQTDGDDANFYQIPRLVNHIDSTAIAQVEKIYGAILKNGMRVLDLMSSWTSHLPEDLDELTVTGLGLNAEELSANKRLSDYLVLDLNKKPVLPFENQSFDAAICTVSVEYLVKPIEVFNEIARVLKPDSPFIVTFSERWFPPKVIKRWTELHPFERMGMVLQYFRLSGRFNDLHTDSIRGLFRPDDDKYANVTPFSDPVYTVWGRVR
jgi:SAM-dependent methyltransferase